MRVLVSLLLYVTLFTFSGCLFANPNQAIAAENTLNDIRELKQNQKNTAADIEILRRDQINYRIEKDLLKDAYASNLEIINVVIAIAFGVVGLLGFLGLRNINEIKADYKKELNELIKLRSDFEADLKTFKSKQKEIEERVGELTKTNKEQDGRLKVLELIEKAAELMAKRQWKWALQYINLGLDIDKSNIPLLNQKSNCHGKLGEFSAAIDASKKIIELEPEENRIPNILNLLEYYVLSNQQSEYQKLYVEYQNQVDEYLNGNMIVYLNTLSNSLQGKLDQAATELVGFAEKYPNEVRQYLGPGWSFEELLSVVSKFPDGKQKDFIVKSMQFFDGKINSNDFSVYLKQQGE